MKKNIYSVFQIKLNNQSNLTIVDIYISKEIGFCQKNKTFVKLYTKNVINIYM